MLFMFLETFIFFSSENKKIMYYINFIYLFLNSKVRLINHKLVNVFEILLDIRKYHSQIQLDEKNSCIKDNLQE